MLGLEDHGAGFEITVVGNYVALVLIVNFH